MLLRAFVLLRRAFESSVLPLVLMIFEILGLLLRALALLRRAFGGPFSECLLATFAELWWCLLRAFGGWGSDR